MFVIPMKNFWSVHCTDEAQDVPSFDMPSLQIDPPLSLLRESEMEFVDDLTDNSQVFDVFHGSVLPSSTTFDTLQSPLVHLHSCVTTRN